MFSNAIIVTIGAVKFDRDNCVKSLEKCDTFYRRISIDSCKKVKLQSAQVTLDWWETQPKEVKYEALENIDFKEILKTHLIDEDMYKDLKNEKYEEFLIARTKKILDLIKERCAISKEKIIFETHDSDEEEGADEVEGIVIKGDQ